MEYLSQGGLWALLVANAYFKNRLRRYATDVELAASFLLRTFGEMERRGIVAKALKWK